VCAESLPSTSRPAKRRRVNLPQISNSWSDQDKNVQLPVFEEVIGVCAPVNAGYDEFDCFSLFFTREFMKIIKMETNRYAGTCIEKLRRKNQLKPNSLWQKWVPIKMSEIYYFFATVLHMCIIKKPTINDYWSKDPILHSTFAASLLSRDRFKSILFMLHLNNNSLYIPRGQPNYDPLFKIRPFYDLFFKTCQTVYNPSSNLTIDEGMCPFRGRIHFRVYNKNKPNKYGIKFYIIADAKNGYVLNAEVYVGSAGEKNTVQDIVERLSNKYFGKGFTIYMDRFYSSPSLFNFLFERKTLAVGTVMPNRKGLPPSFKTTKLKSGDMLFQRSNDLMAVKWRDTRDVLALSTKHQFTSTTVQVRSRNGIIGKRKPDVILDYNINKTGVDHMDQLLSYHPFDRKTIKWWKKVFFHMFLMACVNGYIVYNEVNNKKTHLYNFIKAIGNRFALEGGSEAAEGGSESSRPSTSVVRLSARHFAQKIPPTPKKENPTRYCKVCSDKGKATTGKRMRKESRYYCKDCNVALCVPDCFETYHTKKNFT
jgi:hypothetical protein